MAVNLRELRPEETVEMEIPLAEEVEIPLEDAVEILLEETVEILPGEGVGKRWELREAVEEATAEESSMAGEEETKEELVVMTWQVRNPLEVMTWQEGNLPEPARKKERATSKRSRFEYDARLM